MSKATQEALLKQLKAPFDPKFVKWRIGATSQDKKTGQAVAYIDAREVRKRLDDVMGIGNWRRRIVRFDGGFVCTIWLRIDEEWIERSDAGEDSNMSPVKGGASDAFKRAASGFGVGAYLYYLPKTWVNIKPAGKSFALVSTPELPSWALPGEVERWEDVAELEADLSSGEDQEIVELAIDNLDKIRETQTEAELDAVLADIPVDEQVLLANQIAIKRRGLNHETTINADNS